MIFQGREQLTIVEYKNDFFTFEELVEIFLHAPRNVIYVEHKGILTGIVSVVDIVKAKERGEKIVRINKQFTRIQGKDYAKAKRIFSEKAISAIPIVDECGVLQGNYSSWDDNLFIYYYLDFFIEQNRSRKSYNSEHTVIVVSEMIEGDNRHLLQAFDDVGIRSVRPDALCNLDEIKTFFIFKQR